MRQLIKKGSGRRTAAALFFDFQSKVSDVIVVAKKPFRYSNVFSYSHL